MMRGDTSIMKLEISRESKHKAIANFLVLSGAILFYFIIKNAGNILGGVSYFTNMMTPFVYGFVMAYLLKNPMKYIEKLYKKLIKSEKKQKLVRALSLATTMILAILLLLGFISIIVPQLADSVSIFVSNLPSYMENGNRLLKDTIQNIHVDSEIIKKLFEIWRALLSKTSEIVSNMLPYAINGVLAFSGKLVNIVVGIVVAIYFLAGKERFTAQIKKIIIASFSDKTSNFIIEKSKMTNNIFSKYISGQLTDAAVLGTICFISMSIFKMPYALLVSMIVTVTNIIPIIGPFIGAVPSVFIISMVSGPKALGFAVLILVLQQVDGNILVPKIVGDSTGLSGFWVFLAIFIGGGLFGIKGVILGVPTMAVSYNIIKELVEYRLKIKNKPTSTDSYL